MNQHDWVQRCLAYYEENGLTPEPGGEWQEAHYPAPKGIGTEVIWLMCDHHQVQGLLQSEEYGRQCFYNGEVKKFLNKRSFVPDWFKLYDLYDKWKGFASKNNCKKTGKRNIEEYNSRPGTPEKHREKARKNAEKVSKRILITELITGLTFEFKSTHEAARILGLNRGNLSSVALGNRIQHKGYTASYL